MVAVANTFEGVAAATAVTTANSGGASGDAFNNVSTSGSNVAPTVETARAAHGTKGMQVATPTTAGSSYVEWSTAVGTQTEVWFRMYLYFTAYTAASANIFRVLQAGATGASVGVTSAGIVRIIAAGNATTSLGSAHPLNQWFRVEGRFLASTTTGTCELRRYDSLDSTTPTDTVTATGQVFTSSFDQYRFGLQTSTASWGPVWFDDIAVSSTGYPGPTGATNQAPTADAGAAQSNIAPGATVTLTGSGTDPDGTIASYTWTQTAGTAVTLSGTGASRTFTAPSVSGGATLTFSLVVTDNSGATSAPSTTTVTVNAPSGGNQAPTANAGAAQTVGPWATVTLTGSGTDSDGTIASYAWTQTGGPTVALSGSGATRTFTAPAVKGGTSVTFSLTVTDNSGATSTASTTTVTVTSPRYYLAAGGNWDTPIRVRKAGAT